MYRMILVDDEPIVRSGIRRIIDWAEFGIEIVGEAEDGDIALELCRNLKPDIMLLDIEMICMNGIEVLRALQEYANPPKVIVLSGYNNFEYVRTSMKLGAVNYLLKPVDIEELKNTVRETIDSINSTLHFRQTMDALRNNTLMRVLTGNIELKELREKCSLLGITLRSNCMQVWLMRPAESADADALSKIIEICEQYAFAAAYTRYFLISEENEIVCIASANENPLDAAALQAEMDALAAEVEKRTDVRCIVSHGSRVQLFRELPRSYREAVNMQEYLRAGGAADSIPKSALAHIDYDTAHTSKLFQTHDTSELKPAIHAFCTQIQQSMEPAIWKYHAVGYISHAVNCMNYPAANAKMHIFRDRAYARIHEVRNIYDLEAILVDLLGELIRMDIPEYSPNVQTAVLAARNRYSDSNLSIQTLAMEMNVSAAYLGRMFKQETDSFFNDYLNNARIAAAQKLLYETNMRIADISEAVGFVNPNYFHTIFKKKTGRSPGDLRKNAKNNR